MRIYVFKSSSTARLRAFAGDPNINNLPRQHGPWVITGAIAPDATPPLSRRAVAAEPNTLYRHMFLIVARY